MRESTEDILVFAFVFWAAAMMGSFFAGLVLGSSGTKLKEPRRIDLIVPGYRIGYWLAGPVK